MKKIVLFFLVSVSFSLFSVERIIKEYPELRSFFKSTYDVKSPWYILTRGTIPIEIVDTNDYKIHCTTKFFDCDFLQRINYYKMEIEVSSVLLNRNNISALEFIFMLLREMHYCEKSFNSSCYDPYICVFMGNLYLLNSFLDGGVSKSLRCLGFSGFIFLGLFILLSRRKYAYEADKFAAVTMIKDIKIGCSLLEKQKHYVPRTKSRYTIINYLKAFFADHPSEDDRIDALRKLEVE